MAAIFDWLITLTSESIRISRKVLLDPENVGVVVRIPSLSCIQAEIIVISYILQVLAVSLIFPVTLSSKSIHFRSNVLLDLKNGVICRKFSDISLESRYLNHILYEGSHFEFCRRGFEHCETRKIRMNGLVFNYRTVKTAWKKFQRSRLGSFWRGWIIAQ